MENAISFSLSQEQEAALDVTRSTAVRAGAGSGKTRVLTERFIKLLKVYNADIENIVAITFTEKAALEMRNRIRQRISEELKNSSDDEQIKRWKVYRDSLFNANISTIHSFCQKIIAENFWYLGIDPDYKVLEDVDRTTNIKIIGEECIKEYFEDGCNEGIADFFDIYGVNQIIDGKFAGPLINAYFKLREKGMTLDRVCELTTFDKKLEYLNLLGFKFDQEKMEKLNRIEKLAVKILKQIDSRYSEFKRHNNSLDFNDLEILTLKILDNTDILNHYKQKFKYFMVDEFQDVNPIQSKLIYRFVCDEKGSVQENRLFAVGDYKQSIYGFRGSDCSIFNDLCGTMQDGVKYLSTCYRSTPEIIDTVNKVFSTLIKDYDELNYDSKRKFNDKFVELIKLNKSQEEQDEDVWKKAAELLKSSEQSEELSELLSNLQSIKPVKSKKDNNADILAQKIKSMNIEGILFKDIAILIRSKTNIEAIENSLRGADVPYCILGGIGFWESQEICDLINLYKFVINNNDILSGIAVLRSPIFSLSDNQILKLSIYLKDNNNDFLASIRKFSEDSNKEKIQRACSILEKLSGFSGLMCAYDLLKMMLDTTCYQEILLTQVNGYQRIRNIEKLLQIAEDFDDKGLYNSKDFINYADTYKNSGNREGQAVLDTEDSNSVKILTIHMSKGLQFKNVIIPDIHMKLTKADKNDMIVFDEQYGIVASYEVLNEKNKKEELNPLHLYLQENKTQKELDEAKRILYVGMTRAEEYLCMIGEDQEDKKNEQNTYMKQLNYAISQNTVPYLKVSNLSSIFETECISSGNQIVSHVDDFMDRLNKGENGTDTDDSILWRYENKPQSIFSISQYMQYLDCPRKYFFNFRSGLNSSMLQADNEVVVGDVIFDFSEQAEQQTIVPANIRGSILHKVLEEAVINNLTEEIEIYDLGKKVSLQYLENQDELIVEDFLITLKRYIDNYIKIQKFFKNEVQGNLIKVHTELPFRIPTDEHKKFLLNGVIDRIDVYENNEQIDLYIVDYKSNSVKSNKDIEKYVEHYLPQLIIYCKATKKLIKYSNKEVNIKGAYLFFVDSGEYKKVEFTETVEKSFLDQLNSKLTEITHKDKIEQYECNFGTRCNICEYKEICQL